MQGRSAVFRENCIPCQEGSYMFLQVGNESRSYVFFCTHRAECCQKNVNGYEVNEELKRHFERKAV